MRRTTSCNKHGPTTQRRTGVAHVETGLRNFRIRKRISTFLQTCRCPVFVVSLVAALFGSTFAGPVHSSTLRALVVGINDYQGSGKEDGALSDLGGAVNDASDIAATLGRMDIGDVTVLKDGEATRESMTKAWDELLARSERGDTVLFTFAGHGGQEPERVPGSEKDSLDEVLLLGGFREKGEGSKERIFDNELFAWFQEAKNKGVRVIFVADSCHSGTAVRSIDPRGPELQSRLSKYNISEAELTLDVPETANGPDDEPPENVILLAAGQDNEEIPELYLPDANGQRQIRGALSYTFARAIEGAADADGDGSLLLEELKKFIRNNVQMLAESRQTPNLVSGVEDDTVLVQLASHPPQSSPPASGPVRLAVISSSPVTTDLPGNVQVVGRNDAPDLVWDVDKKEVIAAGDIVAYEVGNTAIGAVIDKYTAVKRIGKASAQRSLSIHVEPNDGYHTNCTEIRVKIDGMIGSYFTLFGLSGDGTVHFLYPHPKPVLDHSAAIDTNTFSQRLTVKPPFGADHIVAVASLEKLDVLNAALFHLDGTQSAAKAAQLLAEAAKKSDGWQSGIQGLFTKPSIANDSGQAADFDCRRE